MCPKYVIALNCVSASLTISGTILYLVNSVDGSVAWFQPKVKQNLQLTGDGRIPRQLHGVTSHASGSKCPCAILSLSLSQKNLAVISSCNDRFFIVSFCNLLVPTRWWMEPKLWTMCCFVDTIKVARHKIAVGRPPKMYLYSIKRCLFVRSHWNEYFSQQLCNRIATT